MNKPVLSKISVLIVDDSAFMRLLLKDMLTKSGEIDVVGSAGDGEEGAVQAERLEPDVVLLDMEMGRYDGLYAVKKIMANSPRPILILSSIGNTNLEPIFEALSLGAVDYMNKPSRSSSKLRVLEGDLIEKIRQLSGSHPKTIAHDADQEVREQPHTLNQHRAYEIIAIGASTGGPTAIEEVVKKLPKNLGIPVLICQHMPANFIHSFVSRLNGLCDLKVHMGTKGMNIRSGQIIVAPGNSNMIVEKDSLTDELVINFSHEKYKDYNNPSINALLNSVAEACGSRAIGVILTGMGKDGAEGLAKIKEQGGYTVAQDESSSVIFGMPRVAIEQNAVRKVLPVREIGGHILKKL